MRHEAPPNPEATDHTGWRRRAAWIVITILCVVAACSLTSARDHQHRSVSPIDEFQYLDYLYRTAHGHLLHDGQLVQQPTLRTVSCRGIELPGYTPPPCGPGPFNPLDYPNLGYNVGTHPPIYFVVDGPTARLLHAAGVGSDFLDAARLLSGVWLGAALALFLYALRLMRLSWPLALVLATVLATSPTVLQQCSIVTPDATLPFSGALFLLSVLRWSSGAWSTRRLALVSVVAGLLSERNLLAGLAAAGALVVLAPEGARLRTVALGRFRLRLKPGWVAAVVVVGSVLVGTEGWLVVRGLTAVHQGHADPLEVAQHATSVSLAQVTGSARDLLPVLGRIGELGAEATNQQNIYFLLNMAVIAAVGATALRSTTPAARALGRSTIATLVLGGPLLVLLVLVVSHSYFALPLRYNLCLIPLALGAAGDSLRSRSATATAAVLGLLGAALTANLVLATTMG